MAKTRKRKTKNSNVSKATALVALLTVLLVLLTVVLLLERDSSRDGVREIETITHGVDVARYQGTIDWQELSETVDFAIVRVGFRSMGDGIITEDSNARYNLQEATKYGVRLGAYFFSTAITAEEAKEEAAWVAEILAHYPITYPVAYNCEGFGDPENRHAHLSVTERTDIALVFLEEMERLGYEAMFYASKNEMEGDTLWEVSRIQDAYKVWVAQYPAAPYPETAESDYSGIHQMWQYTREGDVDGISAPVDMDIAYFGYEGTAKPKEEPPTETYGPDVEAMMDFEGVWEHVTAKEAVNLRDMPSQDDMATVLHTLVNGDVCMRTGISDSGWSRLIYEGQVCYAVSSMLTTDLEPPKPTEDDGIETVFRPVEDQVTAKDAVNLRLKPSVTDLEATVVVQLQHGQVVRRTGINEDVGWSRVEYNGQVLYCVTSYLEVVE